MYTVVGQEQSFSSVHFLLHTKHINSCSGSSGSSGFSDTSEDSASSGVFGGSATFGVSETAGPSVTSDIVEAVFPFGRDCSVLVDVSVWSLIWRFKLPKLLSIFPQTLQMVGFTCFSTLLWQDIVWRFKLYLDENTLSHIEQWVGFILISKLVLYVSSAKVWEWMSVMNRLMILI